MQLFLYDTAIFFYALLLRIASLFHPKAKLFVDGRKAIFSKIREALSSETRPVIWMHCASLGEFEQGRPLIEKIKSGKKDYCIFLTFFSPSGYEIRKNYELADFVFYLPFDTKKNATKLIRILNPKVVLFVKYELWFHYLKELTKLKVPLILFSAYIQKNQVFFKWYGGLHRKMLGFFQQIFVQDAPSKALLNSIGITNVIIAGDTRIDRSMKVLEENRKFENIEIFKGNNQLIIAGSTWPEDEILLRKTMQLLPENYKLLLAPHEIKEDNIQRILKMFHPDICFWDADEPMLLKHRIGLVNSVGHLAFLYKYADMVWVGGGFTKSGIHNIIEPAVFGVPVFFGPNFKRFREADDMIKLNAAATYSTAQELKHVILNKSDLLEKGRKAKEYVAAQLGATSKIFDYLSEKCLDNTL